MEITRQNVCIPSLNEEQSGLRFELFEWLKTKDLTVEQAVDLLDVTAHQIRQSALKQPL